MLASAEMQIVDTWAKMAAVIENVAAARSAVGPGVDIAVDFHGRVHKPVAKVLLKELETFKLMFIEEPVRSEEVDAFLPQLAATATPIALGERLYSRWDFKSVITSGAVDIIQPDPSHAGGITETRKIATMAEAYDVALALHCPLGPIALATCLQIDAVTYNAVIQEQSLGIHYNAGSDLLDYLADPAVFEYADGYVARPTAPGLGIEIDAVAVEKAAGQGHRWRNPVWRREDGALAEW
jgi:galactonate dehydratase